MPTHEDDTWERDQQSAGTGAARAVRKRSRSGGSPTSAARGSIAAGLLRIACGGVPAIGITLALVLAVRNSSAPNDNGALKPLHFLAIKFAGFMHASPGMPELLLYLAVVSIPLIAAHELGHAVVARRRLGGEVRVSVGTAGKIANVRLGQITMSIDVFSHPGRVAGRASFEASRASARDVLWIALAGPAASLIGCALTAWALSWSQGSAVSHNLLWAATAGGAFGVLNIVPFEIQEHHGGPRLRSDGLVALRAARVVWALR